MSETSSGVHQFNQFFTEEVIEEGSNSPATPPAEGGDNGGDEGSNTPPNNPPAEGGEGGEGNGDDADTGDEPGLFAQLNQDFGFEFEEDFQEDYDGIKGYVTKASEEVAKRNLEELFVQFPAMAEMFDFVMRGGTEEQFFNLRKEEVDFSTIQLTDTDEATMEKVVRLKMVADGYSEDEIQEKLEVYKSAAILKSEAESALKMLTKRQAQKKAESIAENERKVAEEKRMYEEFVQSTVATINKGTLKNIQIPEKDKKAFEAFIFQPVDKQGRAARDVVREKMTLEEKLELEYLVFKGLKLSDIIVAKKTTQDLSHLRKNVDKENSQSSRNGNSARKSVAGLPADMKITDII